MHAHQAVQVIGLHRRLALGQRAQRVEGKPQPLVVAAHTDIIADGLPGGFLMFFPRQAILLLQMRFGLRTDLRQCLQVQRRQ